MCKLIRDEIRSGKNDKEIYKKLEEDFGETVLYTPKFDIQTAAIWLAPVSSMTHSEIYVRLPNYLTNVVDYAKSENSLHLLVALC